MLMRMGGNAPPCLVGPTFPEGCTILSDPSFAPFGPTVLVLRMYLTDILTLMTKAMCIRIFIAALFIVDKLYMPIKMAKIKTAENTKYWRACMIAGEETKWYSHFAKQVGNRSLSQT